VVVVLISAPAVTTSPWLACPATERVRRRVRAKILIVFFILSSIYNIQLILKKSNNFLKKVQKKRGGVEPPLSPGRKNFPIEL